MNTKPLWRHQAVFFFLIQAALNVPATASTVSGWWGGTWSCTIDGRPAKMKWAPASTDEGSCDGETCSSASGATWKGSFSDNGSAWVPLTNARPGTKGGLYFNHADGNRWYLPPPTRGRSTGWTTWQNKRYKLACWK
ncbi:DUF6006 family protein [Massilia sp. CF038]|uniref:DUF6006 family protein n=1 Tax=Massilia sp. CF038 TaxID=1881045 RepID=UPI000933639C